MHVVIRNASGSVDVDLRSGRRTVQQFRVELGPTSRRSGSTPVMGFEGRFVADLLWPQDARNGVTVGPIDPAFAALGGLPAALKRHGDARRPRRRLRPPRLLAAFQPRGAKSPGSEVAVDAQTYEPVVLPRHNGAPTRPAHPPCRSTDFPRATSRAAGPIRCSTGGGPAAALWLVGVGRTRSPREHDGAERLADGGPRSRRARARRCRPDVDHHQRQEDDPRHPARLRRIEFGPAALGATTIDQLPAPDEPAIWAESRRR